MCFAIRREPLTPPTHTHTLHPTPPAFPAQESEYGDQMAKARQNTERINSFWRTKKSSASMDEVYAGLLRSGTGGVKRHHELTGALAMEEARQSPEHARVAALLALPPTEEEEAAARAAAAAAAAVAPTAAAAAAAAAPNPAAAPAR